MGWMWSMRFRKESKTTSIFCSEWMILLFSRSVVSDSLRPHRLHHARLPCPSPSPRVCSDSCPLSWWCHPTILCSGHSSLTPALNLSQHHGLFQGISSSHQVAKVMELQLQHQSFQWIFRTDLLSDGLVWSPCSPTVSQESSPTPQLKSINSSTFSLLYGPTLTFVHDYWKKSKLWVYVPLSAKCCLCFLILCLGLS